MSGKGAGNVGSRMAGELVERRSTGGLVSASGEASMTPIIVEAGAEAAAPVAIGDLKGDDKGEKARKNSDSSDLPGVEGAARDIGEVRHAAASVAASNKEREGERAAIATVGRTVGSGSCSGGVAGPTR